MIRTENLQVAYDNFELRDINIEIKRNEFFVLMGPTGAGKTVLLESIAGLTPVRSGAVILNGKDITALPPEKRGVGIVYQDYALFPHMSVRDNITYAVRYHRIDKHLAGKRLDKLCSDLNIGHLLNRYPETLSGGEQQRSALARAMMFEPSVLMLDEPLSALDPAFRLGIQQLLKTLHQSTDITFLMVTHDFSEALSLADRAAVMKDGRIEQTGDVRELFRKPATEFVADFVGMKNIMRVDFDGRSASAGDLKITLPEPSGKERGSIAVRPEDIALYTAKPENGTENCFGGTIETLTDRGFFFELTVRAKDVVFTALITKGALSEMNLAPGSRVFFSFRAEAVHCL